MTLAYSIPKSFGKSAGIFLGTREWKSSKPAKSLVLNASSISTFNILSKETVTFW